MYSIPKTDSVSNTAAFWFALEAKSCTSGRNPLMVAKVFGVGLNKTGTTTLASCLIKLGHRHISCRPDLLSAFRRGDLEACWRVMDDKDSFEDWPYPLMYREIFFKYPDSKFILTKRIDPEVWLRSLKSHSLRTNPTKHCRLLAYGVAYPHGFEKAHLEFYANHNQAVLDFFRENGAEGNLLEVCWERGDGWSQLTDFLDRENPKSVLPHENAGMRAHLDEHLKNDNVNRISDQISLLYPHLSESDLKTKIESFL